jgi:hypothetical protein
LAQFDQQKTHEHTNVAQRWASERPRSKVLIEAKEAPLVRDDHMLQKVDTDTTFGYEADVLADLTDANGIPIYLEHIKTNTKFKTEGWDRLPEDKLAKAARVLPGDAEYITTLDRTLCQYYDANQATAEQQQQGVVRIPVPQKLRDAPLQEKMTPKLKAALSEVNRAKVTVLETQATSNNSELIRATIGRQLTNWTFDDLRDNIAGALTKVKEISEEAYDAFVAETEAQPGTKPTSLQQLASGSATPAHEVQRVAFLRARNRQLVTWSEMVKIVNADIPRNHDSRKREAIDEDDLAAAAANKRVHQQLSSNGGNGASARSNGKGRGGGKRSGHRNKRGRGGSWKSGWGRGGWSERPGSSDNYGTTDSNGQSQNGWSAQGWHQDGKQAESTSVYDRLGGTGKGKGKGKGKGSGRSGKGRGRGGWSQG